MPLVFWLCSWLHCAEDTVLKYSLGAVKKTSKPVGWVMLLFVITITTGFKAYENRSC